MVDYATKNTILGVGVQSPYGGAIWGDRQKLMNTSGQKRLALTVQGGTGVTTEPVVLFIDDDQRLLDGIKRAARKWTGPQHQDEARLSWKAEFRTSANAALSALDLLSCAVLVTDLAMPGLSGYELIKRVNTAHPDIACIMLSGTAELEDTMDLINNARLFRFFTKPTDTEVLFSAVDEAVANWSAAQKQGTPAEDMGLAALDRMSMGVLVVDKAGVIQHGNQSALTLLKTGDVIKADRRGQLRCTQTLEHQKLLDVIEAVLTSPDAELESVAVGRQSRERPYILSVSPLAPGSALIMIVSPDKHPVPSLETLKQAYDLTPSEAKLAQVLATGIGLDEAADQSGLTIETARTYLKRVFRKTETSRQPELVRLLVLAA